MRNDKTVETSTHVQLSRDEHTKGERQGKTERETEKERKREREERTTAASRPRAP